MTHSKPHLVFVPGIDGTALLFYRQEPLLSETFEVSTFALPNNRTASMDDLVDGLATHVANLNASSVLLCGESFGGALSMYFALARPDLVDGLVIVNSFPWVEDRLMLRASPWVLKFVPWAAMPFMRRFTEQRIHSRHTNQVDLDEFHARARHIGRDGYIRRLEMLASYGIRDRLEEIAAPCLFLAGSDDRLVASPKWAAFMADRVPRGTYRLLQGYGHICLITHDLDLHRFVEPWWSAHRSADSEGI